MHRIIETRIGGVGQFSVIEDNDGPVRASSPLRMREADCIMETQTQGCVGLRDGGSVVARADRKQTAHVITTFVVEHVGENIFQHLWDVSTRGGDIVWHCTGNQAQQAAFVTVCPPAQRFFGAETPVKRSAYEERGIMNSRLV